MSEIEIVDRPKVRRNGSGKYRERHLAIVGTVESGQAVRIAVSGERIPTVLSAARSFLNTRGLKLHYMSDGNDVIVWAEKS